MKIAILSRNEGLYSTRRLVEAGTQRGHEMRVIDHLRCYISLEQGKPTVHFEGKNLKGIDAVIPRVGTSATFYGTAIVRQFEMMDVFSAVNSQAIVRSRDKLRSMQLISREGIGMPVTVIANENADINDTIKMVGGAPLVIKLIEGTQGIGVMLAETKKAAKSIIETFHGMEKNILLQEFIAEAKGADLRVFVVDGRVVGAMKRQAVEGEFRSNLHRGGSAKLVELTRDERYTALRAAKVLGLSIAGVDMLQSKRGPLIMEVNSSPGLEGIEKATQVDVAGKIIEYVEKKAASKGVKTKDKIGV